MPVVRGVDVRPGSSHEVSTVVNSAEAALMDGQKRLGAGGRALGVT